MCARSSVRAPVFARRSMVEPGGSRQDPIPMRTSLDLRAAAAALADGEPTMTEVAARLGMAKPTLFKLAGSRAELVRSCVETEAERALGHLYEHAGPAASLADVTAALDAYARDSPGGFRLLFEQRGPAVEASLRRLE